MAEWNDPATTRYINKHVPRVDGPAKVTGRAKYTYDVVLPGMLYGAVLRSPHASAKVTGIDTSPAERMDGVKAVYVVTEAGRDIRYAGQEVAAVAAVTEEIARDAAAAVKVEYEVRPHAVETEAAASDSNRMEPFEREEPEGEVKAALDGSKARVKGEYGVPVRMHTCLESHGAVAHWEGDRLTIYASTQAVHGVRQGMAQNQRVPTGNVRVLCDYMGGGFGSKLGPGTAVRLAVELAKIANAPVKLMFDRYGEQTSAGNGPDAHGRIEAGADAEGKLTAIHANLYGTGGASNRWGAPIPYVYGFGARDVTQRGVSTNCGSQAALRAPMHPQACFITETVVDELAHELGMDPLEFRLKNVGGVRAEQFRLGARRIGWERRNRTPGAGSGRFRRGLGVATGQWGGGGGPGSQVEVVIHADGTVDSKVGSQDLGTGTRTYVASIVAEDLGIDLSRVRGMVGDSNFGYSGGSGGSTTTASLAPAVKTAATQARTQFLAKAAELMETDPDDLELRENQVVRRSAPAASMAFEEVCARLGNEGIVAHGEFDDSLQQGGVAGVQLAEVEVDLWTGRVQPIKIVAVHDCGFVMNRLATESQIIGGVIQGIAMALFEERKMDDGTGRCLNPDLEGYKLPGTFEMPEIVPVLFETHRKVAGIGEPPVIPTAGAIGNAVFNATGLRIRRLPVTKRRVLEAME